MATTLSTSNTYQFGTNTQLDDLFREAYERIGIIGNEQTPLNVQSAIMSANLELSSWPGRGLNLWLIQREMFSIYPNQPIYTLPTNTVRVLEVSATQPARLNTGGTAGSSAVAAGNPANVFDQFSTIGCTLAAVGGYISYDYGVGNSNSILYVGITPLAMSTYTLTVQYSFDTVNWFNSYSAPTQTYFANQITWFVIENSLNARAWRVLQATTDATPLALEQIFFDQPTNVGTGDRLLSALSRSEYMAIATKMNTGFPSGYYFDQTITPTIILWPVPAVNNPPGPTNILYTNYRYAQDITQMFQTAEVPQRFYDALVAGLAARLALKFAVDKFQIMKGEAQEAYAIAANTDFENVTLRFEPDFTAYSG